MIDKKTIMHVVKIKRYFFIYLLNIWKKAYAAIINIIKIDVLELLNMTQYADNPKNKNLYDM
jgi:hypothetical protein